MNKTGLIILAMMALALVVSPRARPAEPAVSTVIDVVEVVEAAQPNPDEESRLRAAQANREAAGDSASGLAAGIRPELEFRTDEHTWVLIAGNL